jgi:O-antigen/teichoic acid export membrane protein
MSMRFGGAVEAGFFGRLRDSLRTSLLRNSFFLLVRSFLNSGLGFLFWFVVAHFYKDADVGLSAAMLSATLLLARGATLGLPTGMLRFLPPEKDQAGLINGVFTLSVVASLAIGVVFLAGLNLWAPPEVSSALQDPLLAAVFLISLIFFTLDSAMDNAFVAARRSDYGMIRSTIFYVVRLPLAVAVVTLGVLGIMFAWTIALVLSVVIMVFLLVRFYPGYRPAANIRRVRGTGMIGFSLWTYVTGMAQGAAVFLLPLMIIGVLGPTGLTESAYFFAAYSLATLLYLVPVAFSTALLVEGSHPGTSYVQDVRATLRYSLPILVAGMVGTLLLGQPILKLFGPNYLRGFDSLLLMVFASPVILLTSIYTTDLRVAKRVRPIFYITTISSAFTLVAAYVLLPIMGISGAAIAFVAGQVLAVPLYVYEKRRVGRVNASGVAVS